MKEKRSNVGALTGGTILVVVGLLALVSQFFEGFNFWGTLWPIIIIVAGLLFFVGMLAGGKSVAGLAIPGSIVTMIGLILFFQNLTNHYESWSYAWTLIIIAVGLGIWIMGAYTGEPGQSQRGKSLVRLGLILFIIFGAFFEMIFRSFGWSKYAFPVALILLGLYLLVARPAISRRTSEPASAQTTPPAPIPPPSPSVSSEPSAPPEQPVPPPQENP